MNIFAPSRNVLTFLSSYFLSSCLLPFCFLTAGCMKETDAPADFGPEISEKQWKAELFEGLRGLNPLSQQPGEFVHTTHEKSYVTGGGPQNVLEYERGETVLLREETDAEMYLTIVTDLVEYNQEGSTRTRFESEEGYKKVVSEAGARLHAMATQGEDPNQIEVTYHNLRSEPIVIDPPLAVRSREGCEGLADCRIRATKVQFDQVVRNPDGSAKRLPVRYIVSTDVPYRASFLEECVAGIGQVGTTAVLVENCSKVVDFRFGSANPTTP